MWWRETTSARLSQEIRRSTNGIAGQRLRRHRHGCGGERQHHRRKDGWREQYHLRQWGSGRPDLRRGTSGTSWRETTSARTEPAATAYINGDHSLGNGYDGIFIHAGANDNTVGGTTAGAGNVISGNRSNGVGISGTGTVGNVVEGNHIGTDITGHHRARSRRQVAWATA